MNGDFLEILFFAMIAAFLVFRLRNVLGKRTGNEQRRDDSVFQPRRRTAPDHPDGSNDSGDNVVALPDRTPIEPAGTGGAAGAALTQIKIADPSFGEESFLSGARSAFEMIVNAFGNGDRETLHALTAGDVREDLEAAIEEREQKGHEFESTLVGIKSVEITGAEMAGREARVTVTFVSEQVNATRDSEGQLVSGSATAVEEATDVWTFARDTRSTDPNWRLVENHEPEEA